MNKGNIDLKIKALVLEKTNEAVYALNIKANEAPMHKVQDVVKNILALGLIENFIEFLEKNENRIDLEYKTGYQKFLILKKEYQNQVIKKFLKSKMTEVEKKANDMAEKVRSVTSVYNDSEHKRITGITNHKQISFKNFNGYFSEDEKYTLEIIGNLDKCIKLQQRTSGVDELEIKLLGLLRSKEFKQTKQKLFPSVTSSNEQISNSSRMAKLIGEVVA